MTEPFVFIVREKVSDPFRNKYPLKNKERKDLIKEVGVHGLVLFEYYLRLAAVGTRLITDEAAAEYFGWNIHTAARWRRALVKAGWFHATRLKGDGQTGYVYYLGKEETKKARKTNETT